MGNEWKGVSSTSWQRRFSAVPLLYHFIQGMFRVADGRPTEIAAEGHESKGRQTVNVTIRDPGAEKNGRPAMKRVRSIELAAVAAVATRSFVFGMCCCRG